MIQFTNYSHSYECVRELLFMVHEETYKCVSRHLVGRDSSVGIATCYGLKGPGTEFPWG